MELQQEKDYFCLFSTVFRPFSTVFRPPRLIVRKNVFATYIECMRHNEGTYLGYDMICESVNSDQEEKEEDVLNGNHIINLNNLITNIDKFLVCKECAQERELQIKLEEER